MSQSDALHDQKVCDSQRDNRKSEREYKNATYRSALDDSTSARLVRRQFRAPRFEIIRQQFLHLFSGCACKSEQGKVRGNSPKWGIVPEPDVSYSSSFGTPAPCRRNERYALACFGRQLSHHPARSTCGLPVKTVRFIRRIQRSYVIPPSKPQNSTDIGREQHKECEAPGE
jgi:hypothetical protein